MKRLRWALVALLLTSCNGRTEEVAPTQRQPTQQTTIQPTPEPPAGDPVLSFSDLVYGPSTGNTDTSLGQKAGEDGAIVSVWGLNLGASQGSSSISVGGVPAARIYYWGNAVPPYSPAGGK